MIERGRLVSAVLMAVEAIGNPMHRGYPLGNVPALIGLSPQCFERERDEK